MLSNDGLDRGETLRAHREAAIRRIAESNAAVLAAQDTTSLNYNRQANMEGIGYTSGKTLGVNTHSCLAVTAEGLVLGVLAQPPYSRAQPHGRARTRGGKKTRALPGKESDRWVQTLGPGALELPESVHVAAACDREGGMAS
jgi:hypothetical protein